MSGAPPQLDRAQAFLQEAFRLDGKLTENAALAPRVVEHVSGNDRLSPAEQADLYREQFFLRHIESLEEDHIGLVHFLGDDGFDAFARAYLRAHPPRTPSLRELGADIATFAATHEGIPEALRELCADMARYELVLVDVFDAIDVPPPDAARLGALPQDLWLTRPLVWTPQLRLLALRYPAPELRIAIKNKTLAKEPPPKEPAYYGVFRRDDVVVFERLTAEACSLLVLLTGGESLTSACEKLSQRMTDEEASKVEAEVGTWFQRWASWGWILDVESQ